MSKGNRSFQHEGHYICKCGKEFTKSQSFNAHKSNCREYLGEEKYLSRLQTSKKAGLLGAIKAAEKNHQNKVVKELERKLEWESTTHYCERCGKELPHEYEAIFATGRFCSRACANARNHSEDTKAKIALRSNINGKANRSLNGYYKGYYCASSYELIFLVYCLDHNIKIERNEFTFKYEYDGKTHIYNPDWYLPETDTIIECKGKTNHYNEEIVNIKSRSVLGHNYIVLYEEDLKDYWNYCKEVYGVKTYKRLCALLYEDGVKYEQVKPPRKTSWNVKENNPAWGRHWYTNGIDNKYTYECPTGYYPGRVRK